MADEEMRDVIEEVGEEKIAEGLAPDDDFAEADASAGESDDEDDHEEYADDDDDAEVRVISNPWGFLCFPSVHPLSALDSSGGRAYESN